MLRFIPALRRMATVAVVVALVMTSCGGSGQSDGPLAAGRSVYGSTCSACHGSSGQGGVGPGFGGVASTFPSCVDQIKWITLGSERWKAEIGPTYGATDKPIEKIMPEMGKQLTSDEIAAVAAFERIQYGGTDEAATLAECGVPAPDTP